jgi:HEAT repeat protein
MEFDRVLPKLFKEDDLFLRLGVMYLLEELSEKNRDLEGLRLKIVSLLQDDDPRVREDAIMALGKIGGENELKILEELLIEESDEIKEAVVEAIEEIRERIGSGKKRSY